MKGPIIELKDWLPDQPEYANPGATVVENAVPTERGFGSFNQLVPVTNSLGGTAKGLISALDRSGNVYNFAGTSSNLYRLDADSWTSVSTASFTYSLATNETWDWTQYGSNIYAAAGGNPIQKYDMDSSSAFATMSATAPQARHIAMVRSFLVAGNCYDASLGAVPSRVAWSPIGNPSGDWTPSQATMAGYRDLAGPGGWVQAVVGGEYGVVFQERAITRMTFVGPPVHFQMDTVEHDRGTPSPRSVVKVGGIIYYLGQDGFYAFNGAQSVPIGRDRVDKTFYSDVDQNRLTQVVGVADPINTLVVWVYPSSGSAGLPNKAVIYNWKQDRWGPVSDDYSWIGLMRTSGLDVDTGLQALGPTDSLNQISLDSRYWTGGKIGLAAFNNSNRLCTFTGDPLAAKVETKELELISGRVALLQRFRPILEGTPDTLTCNVGTRFKLTDAVTWDGSSGERTDGSFEYLIAGRYHRFRVSTTGSFSHLSAVQIEEMEDDGEV